MPFTEFAKVMPPIAANASGGIAHKPLPAGTWTLCNVCRKWYRRPSTTRYSFEFREAVCPDCKAKQEATDAV